MLVFVQRIPVLPSAMVTGDMRVTDRTEVPEGPCNLSASGSAQPCASFENLRCIHATFQQLNASGWYWGNISASQAGDALAGTAEGTFLVRDSSHTHYFFTLSVKTNRGPTNVRIEFSGNRFRLDYTSSACPRLLSFPTVSELVQHYVGTSKRQERPKPEENAPAALKDSAVLLKLRQPLYKPKPSPRYSTWSASPSTNTQIAQNICPYLVSCCSSYRTIPSKYNVGIMRGLGLKVKMYCV